MGHRALKPLGNVAVDDAFFGFIETGHHQASEISWKRHSYKECRRKHIRVKRAGPARGSRVL